MSTLANSQKCRICDKIETKQRRRSAELDRISRWRREGSKFRASIERSEDIVDQLEHELADLVSERRARSRYVCRGHHRRCSTADQERNTR